MNALSPAAPVTVHVTPRHGPLVGFDRHDVRVGRENVLTETASLDSTSGFSDESAARCPSRHPECGSHRTGHRWYCVKAKPREEYRAFEHLARQGFEPWLPRVMERRGGEEKIMLMFPGYLFARFDVADPGWRTIWSTFGVASVLGSTPERPTPVRDDLVTDLQARGRAGDGVVDALAVPFRGIVPGETTVRILGGPLHEFEGLVTMAAADRVRVLLSLFGRPTTVTVHRGDVRVLDA